VFAEMVADNTLSFEAVFFKEDCWYEIDTIEDLHEADKLFRSPVTTSPFPDGFDTSEANVA